MKDIRPTVKSMLKHCIPKIQTKRSKIPHPTPLSTPSASPARENLSFIEQASTSTALEAASALVETTPQTVPLQMFPSFPLVIAANEGLFSTRPSGASQPASAIPPPLTIPAKVSSASITHSVTPKNAAKPPKSKPRVLKKPKAPTNAFAATIPTSRLSFVDGGVLDLKAPSGIAAGTTKMCFIKKTKSAVSGHPKRTETHSKRMKRCIRGARGDLSQVLAGTWRGLAIKGSCSVYRDAASTPRGHAEVVCTISREYGEVRIQRDARRRISVFSVPFGSDWITYQEGARTSIVPTGSFGLVESCAYPWPSISATSFSGLKEMFHGLSSLRGTRGTKQVGSKRDRTHAKRTEGAAPTTTGTTIGNARKKVMGKAKNRLLALAFERTRLRLSGCSSELNQPQESKLQCGVRPTFAVVGVLRPKPVLKLTDAALYKLGQNSPYDKAVMKRVKSPAARPAKISRTRCMLAIARLTPKQKVLGSPTAGDLKTLKPVFPVSRHH